MFSHPKENQRIRNELSVLLVQAVVRNQRKTILRGRRAEGRSPRVNAGIERRRILSVIKEVAELLPEKSTSQSSGKLEIHHTRTHGMLNTLGLGAIDEAITPGGSAIGLYSRRLAP